MSDTTNIYNISKSTDIMHLILRLIFNCNDYNDTLLSNILVRKFFNYNHTTYNGNLLEDIFQKRPFNLEDIYIFSRDYYALFNYIASLPKYSRIFRMVTIQKEEFKNEVLPSVLSNFRPNNSARIFTEIIGELKTYI